MSSLQSYISQVGIFFLLLTSNTLAASNATVIPLKSSAYGAWFTAELQFGGQVLSVIADTGSADLWVLASDWNCYAGSVTSLNGTAVSRNNCPFNESYTQTSTFQPIDSAWIAEVYGQGDIVGSVGYENVQIGSLTLSQQEMAFVNATTNGVDFSVSGILGLAYPVLDSVHPSSYHLSNDSTATKEELDEEFINDRVSYPTINKRLLDMGITFFSFALQRMPLDQETGFGGYLSFGTLPPVPHGEFFSVTVEELKRVPLLLTNGTKQLAYWTLTVDALTWQNETSSQPFQAVVDSGNALNYVPSDIAAKVNAAFDPPGKFDPATYTYSIECSATPPADFGISIGGYYFLIEGVDMVVRVSGESCVSGFGASPPFVGGQTAILGDAFLKNVVAVFDFSQNEMRFAQRQAELAPSSEGTIMGLNSRYWSFAVAAVLVIVTLY